MTAKDLILAIIGQIGTGGGQGYVVEYRGEAIRSLSMEGRLTVCNMSIEAGARAGLIAPDEVTFEYLKGRKHAPQGADWDAAVEYWQTLSTDDGAVFDHEVTIDATALTPYVTWGTNPGQALPLGATVPAPSETKDPNATERALTYMGLTAGTPLRRSRSTPCSSAPAPTAGSRTCAPPPTSSAAGGSPTASACWSSPARCRSARRPRPRGSTRSSPRRAPSGAAPAARCAWA